MKLLLAFSVVLLTLFVLAESSPEESREVSLKDSLKSIKQSIKDAVVNVGQKAKSAIKKLKESKLGTNTRRLISEGVEKIKNKFNN